MDQTSGSEIGDERREELWSDDRYAGWAGDDIYAEVAKLPWPTLPDA